MHSTAGYLLGAVMTVKYVFDVHPEDKFACMADVGWITGHTYVSLRPCGNSVWLKLGNAQVHCLRPAGARCHHHRLRVDADVPNRLALLGLCREEQDHPVLHCPDRELPGMLLREARL